MADRGFGFVTFTEEVRCPKYLNMNDIVDGSANTVRIRRRAENLTSLVSGDNAHAAHQTSQRNITLKTTSFNYINVNTETSRITTETMTTYTSTSPVDCHKSIGRHS